MSGYSEVIQVIGAMIIFSMIMMSTSRHMLTNTSRQVGSEVEVRAVGLGQDFIELAKNRPFDEATNGGTIPVNIPADFTTAPIPESNAQNRTQLIAFEHFNGYSEEVNSNLGEFTISSTVTYMNETNLTQVSTSKTRAKRITVTVNNGSLNNEIQLSYTRIYNNQN